MAYKYALHYVIISVDLNEFTI